jgi:hypothetical protein
MLRPLIAPHRSVLALRLCAGARFPRRGSARSRVSVREPLDPWGRPAGPAEGRAP